jgi:outer membrane protein
MTAPTTQPRISVARLLVAAAVLSPIGAQAQTLSQMLGTAYLFSPALKSARYSLDAVNEQRPQALSGWLPTVTLTGTAYPNQTTQPSALGPGTRYNQLTNTTLLTLPITQGGGEYARLHGAEHTILAARASLLSAEQTILFTAVTAYADVLTDRAIVKAETENVEALRQMLVTVTRQVQAGERTMPEQTLARLRVSDAEATLIDGRSQAIQAESRYLQSTGVAPGPGLTDPAPLTMLPGTLDDARRLALSENPTVRASIYIALAARDGVDQAIATLLPSLSFIVSDERYRQNWPSDTKYLNGSYSSTFFGLQLTVPIYQGGSEYAAVRIAKKTALARDKDRESSNLDAVSSTEQAWEQRSDAADQVRQYQDTLHVADQLVEQYRREVAAGEITVFEALDGYSSKLTAQVSLYSATRNKVLSDYGLLLAVGGLTARTLVLDVPYYDPAGDYQRTKWRILGLGVE